MKTFLDEILATEILHETSCGCAACCARNQEFEQQYDIILKDSRILTTNTTEAPFRYICHLELNGHVWGSGALIGPKTVLTAAHCVWNRATDKLIDLSSYTLRVIPGRNGASEPYGSAKAVKLIPSSGYNRSKAVTQSDYAIIHLDKSFSATAGFWSYGYRKSAYDPTGTSILTKALPLPPGELPVNLSGYPSDKGGTQQYRSFEKTVRQSNGMLLYLNDSFSGHSGSPVWVRRSPDMGGRVLVGIHVGRQGATTTNPNLAVLINDTIRSFISNNTI